MLTKDELFVVTAIEGDEENGDDQAPAFAPNETEDDDVYGDGGLGFRSLLEVA